MLTAILVEDMPQAMQLLEADLITYCPDIEIIGMANSVVSAAKLIRTNVPDVLFLDINLGDGTAFDLLEIFPNITSKIIFITASEEHALRAFRFSAIDYLLKPINSAMLIEAVKKVLSTKSASPQSLEILRDSIKSPLSLPSRISLHTQDKISVVAIQDIVRCESDGNNTWFHLTSKEKLFVTKTLKSYDDLLHDHNFVRVHQSHLVNASYIQEFSKKDGGFLKMKNSQEVPVSVRKKAEIMQLLEDMSL